MSSTYKPRIQTFYGDAVTAKGKAVKIGSTREHVALGSANTDRCIGIAQNTTTAIGDAVEVALIGGGAKALLGETVTAGAYLVSHTDGTLVKANAASDHVVAIAMEGGDAAELIDVMVVCFNAHAAEA